MTRFKGAIVCLLLPFLVSCAGELRHQDLQLKLAGLPPDAQLDLLAQQNAQYPDDLEIRSWYLSMRRHMMDDYLSKATVAYRAGDPAQALEWARKAQQIAPGDDNPRALIESINRQASIDSSLKRAESVRGDDPQEALAIVNDALAKQPDNTRAAQLRNELLTPKTQELVPKLNPNLDQPITVQFRDQPLISIFELVSNITGLNFTFDRDVAATAPTTIYASNTPVRQVLSMILQANQLASKVVSANSILLYPKRADKDTEYRDMVVRTFYLHYAQAPQVLATLKQMVKTRDVVLDERTNSIIMRDSPETVKVAERLVSALDVAPGEVVIEAQILEVSANDLLKLGILYPGRTEFGLTTTPDNTNQGTLTLDQLRNLNSSNVLVTVGPAAVDFLQTHGITKVLADPRIRVKDRDKAKVLIGDRLPVVTTTLSSNFSSESVNYQDVGLTLEVTPTIVSTDEVQVKMRMEVSNVTDTITTSSGLIVYQIGTRSAETVMSVHNNETQVLAGLLNRNERDAGQGLPGLSRIPLLDRIFGTKSNEAHETELVLLLTPRIVRNQAVPPGSVVLFNSGTDSRISTERDPVPVNESMRLSPANRNAPPPPPPTGAPPALPPPSSRGAPPPAPPPPPAPTGASPPDPAPPAQADASPPASGVAPASYVQTGQRM